MMGRTMDFLRLLYNANCCSRLLVHKKDTDKQMNIFKLKSNTGSELGTQMSQTLSFHGSSVSVVQHRDKKSFSVSEKAKHGCYNKAQSNITVITRHGQTAMS